MGLGTAKKKGKKEKITQAVKTTPHTN